ncbi:integrase catalytic domain-containing protein [Trichonephila inaurata madagascariensis]|uniref:Integrase catalytic domain-containing protein n=1 Tax=Trichonephila inaurata madagascariensis TaxID=2747483 RepID=A0A8X6YP31_9ARAC|nr:integrase catalytic domain-containing protein [Trichonephila inaurata madagascariensis]
MVTIDTIGTDDLETGRSATRFNAKECWNGTPQVAPVLQIKGSPTENQIYLWTDSSIVLAWAKKPLAELKKFVRNWVNITQELTENNFWKRMNSENNPADILSRGISPNKIQHCELWWFGTPFLHQYKELEPYDITDLEGDDLFLQKLKEKNY